MENARKDTARATTAMMSRQFSATESNSFVSLVYHRYLEDQQGWRTYRAKRPGAKASIFMPAAPVATRSAVILPMAGPRMIPERPAPVAM